jgi:hypothetical protein
VRKARKARDQREALKIVRRGEDGEVGRETPGELTTIESTGLLWYDGADSDMPLNSGGPAWRNGVNGAKQPCSNGYDDFPVRSRTLSWIS